MWGNFRYFFFLSHCVYSCSCLCMAFSFLSIPLNCKCTTNDLLPPQCRPIKILRIVIHNKMQICVSRCPFEYDKMFKIEWKMNVSNNHHFFSAFIFFARGKKREKKNMTKNNIHKRNVLKRSEGMSI